MWGFSVRRKRIKQNLLNLTPNYLASEKSSPNNRNSVFYHLKKSFINRTGRSQGHVQKDLVYVRTSKVLSLDLLYHMSLQL